VANWTAIRLLASCGHYLVPTAGGGLGPGPQGVSGEFGNRPHSKRKVVEPDRLLSARELAERVCAALACPYEPHLTRQDHAHSDLEQAA